MVTCLTISHAKLVGDKSQAPSYKVEMVVGDGRIKIKLCRDAVRHLLNNSAGTDLDLKRETSIHKDMKQT